VLSGGILQRDCSHTIAGDHPAAGLERMQGTPRADHRGPARRRPIAEDGWSTCPCMCSSLWITPTCRRWSSVKRGVGRLVMDAYGLLARFCIIDGRDVLPGKRALQGGFLQTVESPHEPKEEREFVE